MALIQDWFPPSRENYELILSVWLWFPVAASAQWLTSWYGMGKTSVQSRLNLPGRVAWLTMEIPGPLVLAYMMRVLPAQHGVDSLPWQNKVLAALYLLHYSYRAVLFPLVLQPSMSPMHVAIWASAVAFQVCNGLLIGSWLAAFGPTTQAAWAHQLGYGGMLQFTAGLVVFYVGLVANYYHDDELREIRRREMHRQQRVAAREGRPAATIAKFYQIPQAGLFSRVLYAHYLVEWVEWFGFWMAAGWSCAPARCFLANEMASMLPRAVSGKKWYEEKFGKEKIKGRWAVIPGVW